MIAVPWRVQIGAVVAGYASVLGISTLLVFARYEMYARNPAEAAAAGGMYAAGDSMLAMFIAFMLVAATILLAFVIRNSEAAYKRYAQILLGISLTAPLCMVLLTIPATAQSSSMFGFACMFRVETSPLVIVGLVISRLLAKFRTAKRLTSIAIAIEVLTLAGAIASVLVRWL